MGTRYNGYTNYETWAVKNWIDNDEGSQAYWLEQARGAQVGDLAQQLQDEHNDAIPDDVQGVLLDLLNAGLSAVDWVELAEDLIRDAKEQDGDEDAEPQEPDDDDITTADQRTWYQGGRAVLTVADGADSVAALRAYMDEIGFWPNCWVISDHGNAHLLSI